MINWSQRFIPTDINECMDDNGGCEDDCENTIGSFLCTCPSFIGEFRANGKRCVGMYLMFIGTDISV